MTNALDTLPTDLARHRVLNAAQAASFWGVSVVTWRRLYRANAVPAPMQLSARRYGWTVGSLIDAQAAKRAA